MICVFFLFCSLVAPGPIPDVAGQVSRFEQPAGLVFLAHSNLDGARFADIESGDLIHYYADGWQEYRVTAIIEAQAVPPESTTPTLWIDSRGYTVEEIHRLYFSDPDRLVLMTCLERDGVPSWGRLIVISERTKEQ
jgi:hypothetical protein